MKTLLCVLSIALLLTSAPACHASKSARPDAGITRESNDSECRALIGYRAEPDSMGTVMVNVCTGVVRVAGGLLVVDQDGDAWMLSIRTHNDAIAGPGGMLRRRWDDLVASRLRDGVERVWFSGEPPENEAPGSLVQGNRQFWEVEHRLTVTGYAGPWLGVHNSVTGFFGGAHQIDESYFSTIEIGTGRSLHLFELLDDAAYRDMEAAVESEAADRVDDGWTPELPPWDELGASALVFESGELKVATYVPCCTWAENHNLLEVVTDAHLTPDSGRWQSTGSAGWVRPEFPEVLIGLTDGVEELATAEVPDNAHPLGVTWLPESETLDLSHDDEVMAE